MVNRKTLILVVVSIIALVAYFQTSVLLSSSERGALVVLIFAAGLWTTEAVPLSATALLIPLLQTLLGVQGFKGALAPFFDPVVALLLGGFMLARAVEKYDLDEFFAYQIVSRVPSSAKVVVLVLMFTSAFLSMWISNTATTTLLIAMVLKIIKDIRDDRGNFSKIMVLGIAYSATAGGLSTLVGTTTCAMAAASLKDLVGYEISFLGWSFFGFPITFLMVIATWITLFAMFPTDVDRIPVETLERKPLDRKQKYTLLVFALAILLWFTGLLPEPIALVVGWGGHGLSSGVVAIIVGVLLLFTGLLEEHDLGRVNWNALLLIGGGLSLGAALEVSGLVVRISDILLLLTGGASWLVTIAMVVVFGLGLSIIASNTASAAIFLPIAISLANTTGTSPVILAVAVGISTSLDFMLPVGTPPNAIAYSTGKVSMRDMIKAGILLDLASALITTLLAYFLWPALV